MRGGGGFIVWRGRLRGGAERALDGAWVRSNLKASYLQKVVGECYTPGWSHCRRDFAKSAQWRVRMAAYLGWTSKNTPNFTTFARLLEERATLKGTPCAIDHHYCRQVDICLFTAQAGTVRLLRLEDEPRWLPCSSPRPSVRRLPSWWPTPRAAS